MLIQDALLGAVASSLSVPKADGELLTLLVVSVRGRDVGRLADQGLSDAAVLIYIVDPGNRSGASVAAVADAYCLTHAEAKVAVAIASGLSIPEAATQLGLSINTVKTHPRKVFSKTGTARQAELARVLTMIGQIKIADH